MGTEYGRILASSMYPFKYGDRRVTDIVHGYRLTTSFNSDHPVSEGKEGRDFYKAIPVRTFLSDGDSVQKLDNVVGPYTITCLE